MFSTNWVQDNKCTSERIRAWKRNKKLSQKWKFSIRNCAKWDL